GGAARLPAAARAPLRVGDDAAPAVAVPAGGAVRRRGARAHRRPGRARRRRPRLDVGLADAPRGSVDLGGAPVPLPRPGRAAAPAPPLVAGDRRRRRAGHAAALLPRGGEQARRPRGREPDAAHPPGGGERDREPALERVAVGPAGVGGPARRARAAAAEPGP